MNNKSACKTYVSMLNAAWKETASKRNRLLELSKLPNPTDEQCDKLIEWAADVCRVMSPENMP